MHKFLLLALTIVALTACTPRRDNPEATPSPEEAAGTSETGSSMQGSGEEEFQPVDDEELLFEEAPPEDLGDEEPTATNLPSDSPAATE